MSLQVGVAKHPANGKKVLLFQSEPEPWEDVMGMLRMLKSQFPEEWRAIHYEIGGGRMNGLVVPEGARDERRDVSTNGHTGQTPGPDPSGDSQLGGSDGA